VSELLGRHWSWIAWLLIIVAVTWGMVVVRNDIDEAHVALAYLVVILIASSQHGGALGITLSITAFLFFDWFFVAPYGTLAVAKPFDWGVLAAFLLTSVVAARLFERVRLESALASDRARELDHLASVREASSLKDAVLAAVSHDLRTPLTTIKALATEIASEGDDRALTIQEEADRLNSLVTDLLDIARINSGGATLNPEPNEAEDLVGAAMQRVQGTLCGREIKVVLEPGDPLLVGRFDFAQTLRALVNLIENALKYSPPTEPVELRVKREGGWLLFSVLDRGPGIPEGERERIFEPFYRQPGSPPDAGGAGLGLSIAHALAAAQNCKLTYEPRSPGGSIFTFSVPAIDVEELTQA